MRRSRSSDWLCGTPSACCCFGWMFSNSYFMRPRIISCKQRSCTATVCSQPGGNLTQEPAFRTQVPSILSRPPQWRYSSKDMSRNASVAAFKSSTSVLVFYFWFAAINSPIAKELLWRLQEGEVEVRWVSFKKNSQRRCNSNGVFTWHVAGCKCGQNSTNWGTPNWSHTWKDRKLVVLAA